MPSGVEKPYLAALFFYSILNFHLFQGLTQGSRIALHELQYVSPPSFRAGEWETRHGLLSVCLIPYQG